MQNYIYTGFVCMLIMVVSGCITETSGGMPGPASDEERVAAQLDLARGYLEQGDFVRAKKPLERALKINPRSVETHAFTALVLQAENEPELAERHYRTALGIQPNHAQTLNNFASFLYAQERFADALVPLQRLVKDTNYRGRPQAFESLGLAHLKNGDAASARDAFSRALELNFRLARSALELGQLAYDAGDLPEANRRFEQFTRMARPTARSLCLGLKLAEANNDQDKIASYDLSLKNLFPEQRDQCRSTI